MDPVDVGRVGLERRIDPQDTQSPSDLANHRCLNYRLLTAGSTYRWTFGETTTTDAPGAFLTNDIDLLCEGLRAVCAPPA